MSNPTEKKTLLDYNGLSNEELRLILGQRMPGATFLPVTNETRQTAIAMLKITEDLAEE